MSNQEVPCPYCGHQISNDDEKCPNCGEFFVEPNLSEFRFVSIPLYLTCDCLFWAFRFPFLCPLIWISCNCKNIINIAREKDVKKFKIIFFWFFLFVLLTVFLKQFILISLILERFLVYRVLRIIEKFTFKKYNSPITHHTTGMLIFGTLYFVYYLDTYLMRVKDPNLRYCLDIDMWFKYSLILVALFCGLYVAGFISILFKKI